MRFFYQPGYPMYLERVWVAFPTRVIPKVLPLLTSGCSVQTSLHSGSRKHMGPGAFFLSSVHCFSPPPPHSGLESPGAQSASGQSAAAHGLHARSAGEQEQEQGAVGGAIGAP